MQRTKHVFREIHDPSFGTVKQFNRERGYGFLTPTDKTGAPTPKARDIWFHVNDHRGVTASEMPGEVEWKFRRDFKPHEPQAGERVIFELTAGIPGKSKAYPWAPTQEYLEQLALVTSIDHRIIDANEREVWIGGYSQEAGYLENRVGSLPDELTPDLTPQSYPLGIWEWTNLDESALSELQKATAFSRSPW